MSTLARLIALAVITAALCYGPPLNAQTVPQKKPASASVSGRVTLHGKGLPGVTITAYSQPFMGQGMPLKAVTDQEGNYRLTKIPPGTYQISQFAPIYVSAELSPTGMRGKSLILAESDDVKNIDFALERGGVITGKVTDPEGRPVIEERVMLADVQNKTDGPGAVYGISDRYMTDDRGVYRIYGVPPGRYRVSAGTSESDPYGSIRPGRVVYRQTYYPDVVDAAAAKVVEVTAGSEAVGINISLGRSLPSFSASGRVIDGETSQPVSGVRFMLQRQTADGPSTMPIMSASNSQGEFRVENIAPGKYSLFNVSQAGSEVRTETVPFEVTDQDVTGLLVKTVKSATVTGVVVIEGTADKTAFSKLAESYLSAYVRSEDGQGIGGQQVALGGDGSFRIGGLKSGTLNLFLTGQDRRPSVNLTILRLERDGMVQPRGIEIKAGEQVNGIKVVLSYGTGSIRGQLKYENGTLPPEARVGVWIKKPGETEPTLRGNSVDVRGHFLLEGIAAGTYELNVSVNVNTGRRLPPLKQMVNVADGAVTDVEVIVDLQPAPNP
jgi:protocatechuate 3,4-dioxygenase beta subunit